MNRAREAAKAHGSDLAEKIVKMIAHERALEKRVAELEKQLLEGGSSGGGIDGMLASAQEIDDVHVLAVRVADDTSMANMRELAEKLRDKLGAKAVVLVAAACGDKAQLALTVSKRATDKLKAGMLIKPIAERVGGRGGGRPDMAQAGGTDPSELNSALESVVGWVSERA
jgi:alanyl-tRNA synthetase